MKSRLMKIKSAFLRYVEREYKDVLDIMATSRIHSIKPTQNSNKTTKNGT